MVLVILGLLAGVIGPQVMKHVGTSKSKTATVQIEELATALEMYRLELAPIRRQRKGWQFWCRGHAGVEQWNGPYLRKPVVPKDPWGRDYRYRHPGEHGTFDIYSLGADNADGGDGESADVVNWK